MTKKIIKKNKDKDFLPKQVCLLPISERPIFPPQTLPILMNEDEWQETIEYINDEHENVTGLVLVKMQSLKILNLRNFIRLVLW